jgi:hypothetical protein
MQVYYTVHVLGADKRRRAEYVQSGMPTFCCPDMAREWGDLFGFGVKGSPRYSDNRIYLYTRHTFTSGSSVYGVTPVAYCPFCGARIETSDVSDPRGDWSRSDSGAGGKPAVGPQQAEDRSGGAADDI